MKSQRSIIQHTRFIIVQVPAWGGRRAAWVVQAQAIVLPQCLDNRWPFHIECNSQVGTHLCSFMRTASRLGICLLCIIMRSRQPTLLCPCIALHWHAHADATHMRISLHRGTNIQLINTVGVAPEDMQECIECWCPPEEAGGPATRGSLFCCKQCPTNVTLDAIDYRLETNFTYRYEECTSIVSMLTASSPS